MKGISTIVSTVMVLAVAISMVGIFSGWAPNVLGDVLDSTENQTTEQTTCNQASIEIRSATYDSNNDRTTAVVSNESTVNVGEIRVSAWDEGSLLGSTSKSLDGGLESINVSSSSTPTRVEASSLDCPSTSDKISEIQ